MDQKHLTNIFCARPQNFAWFIGAGASRSAGLPTATDIIWDLKRRYYCQEENQDVSRQDIQSDAVKARIQAFLDSRGFPAPSAPEEYATYFEKIFGDDLERQRRYLHGILSEDKVTLAVGNRVLGALLASGLSRAAFTTNFDTVVEKAVAEVSGKSLAAFHLEGPHAAWQAINNEEFPVYCKHHGDFRYEKLKNLPQDLKEQNEELAKAFAIASGRFGFIVAGYSGRDASIIDMFRTALAAPNPFPHGLYWAGLSTSTPLPAVDELLREAQAKGVEAHAVTIETFDSLMLRLWRNIADKPQAMDAKVRKAHFTPAVIPLAGMGTDKPIVRLNGLPILSLPSQCHSVTFREPKDWDDVRAAVRKSDNGLILTKSDTVWSWGPPGLLEDAFGEKPVSVEPRSLPADLGMSDQLHVKRFVEDALCAALVRGKPLLTRMTRTSAWILIDPHASDASLAAELGKLVGKTSGTITGLFTEVTEEHPDPSKVSWAETIRVSIDIRNGHAWLLLDPDIWIWPLRAREIATDFMSARRRDRYNRKYNTLLDAWIRLVLGSAERGSEIVVSAFADGGEIANPTFRLFNRSGFAWRLKA
jgi:hypothetical protein